MPRFVTPRRGEKPKTAAIPPDREPEAPSASRMIFEKDGLLCFAVRVQPRSSRLGFAGGWAGGVKVLLTAPAVEDRANRQLLEFLADQLGVAKSSVRLMAGSRARDKSVGVAGIPRTLLESKLSSWLE